MNVEILIDADAVAQKAAEIIAAEARATVAARGGFVMAVSGGHTPWKMLRALANEKVPWEGVRVVQVDERVAPPGGRDVGERIDVHMAVARVPEDRDGYVPPTSGFANPGDVSAEPLQRHTAVLDHLQRAARLREAGQRRARHAADRP